MLAKDDIWFPSRPKKIQNIQTVLIQDVNFGRNCDNINFFILDLEI